MSLIKFLNEMAHGFGRVYAKMQSKLKKFDVDASIDAIREFFEGNPTPRATALKAKLTKLGYDPDREWIGNESFFSEMGVSKEDFMAVMKEVNLPAFEGMAFEPCDSKEGETFEGKTTMVDHNKCAGHNGCPTKTKEEENEQTRLIRCPACKAQVPADEMDEHMDEHETEHEKKRLSKKLRKVEEEEVVKEAQDPTHLTNDQKNRLVSAMKTLAKIYKVDATELAYLTLDDVSGFETAPAKKVAEVAKELADLYVKNIHRRDKNK